MSAKKILVTGGAGYIGTHTCVELIEAGHEVVVFDNLSNSKAVGESVKFPLKYFQNNVTGSIYLFDAMQCAEMPGGGSRSTRIDTNKKRSFE